MLERLTDYGRKARLLRQIMSNKARRYARINAAANMATVVVSSFLTFMGFVGTPKIHAWVSRFLQIDETVVDLAFNALVFSLFVVVILHLVFRFVARQAEAERAIVMLTHLVNEVDDLFARVEHGHALSGGDLDLVRGKYDTLVQVIPANSDREYLRAKKDYLDKEERKINLELNAREVFDPTAQRRIVQAVLQQSGVLVQVLEALRKVDERLYLGGGLIRNAVWDYLHGYTSPTPIDDVDVIYFDNLAQRKENVFDKDIDTRYGGQRLKVRKGDTSCFLYDAASRAATRDTEYPSKIIVKGCRALR